MRRDRNEGATEGKVRPKGNPVITTWCAVVEMTNDLWGSCPHLGNR